MQSRDKWGTKSCLRKETIEYPKVKNSVFTMVLANKKAPNLGA